MTIRLMIITILTIISVILLLNVTYIPRRLTVATSAQVLYEIPKGQSELISFYSFPDSGYINLIDDKGRKVGGFSIDKASVYFEVDASPKLKFVQNFTFTPLPDSTSVTLRDDKGRRLGAIILQQRIAKVTVEKGD